MAADVCETSAVAFGLGFGVFGLIVLVNIASLVLGIAMIVSASKYPDWAFERTGGNKFIWQILPIILIFVCGWANLVMGIIWFTSKRDEVERAAQSGGTPYGYGPPHGSWATAHRSARLGRRRAAARWDIRRPPRRTPPSVPGDRQDRRRMAAVAQFPPGDPPPPPAPQQ